MKISAKGRYGLAAVTYIAKNSKNGEFITVIRVAEELGFSKIYLEQIFSILKKSGILTSVKGSQGGYQLTKSPNLITAFDVLQSTETSLCESISEEKSSNSIIEETLQGYVFNDLSNKVKCILSSITIHDIVTETENNELSANYMYFI